MWLIKNHKTLISFFFFANWPASKISCTCDIISSKLLLLSISVSVMKGAKKCIFIKTSGLKYRIHPTKKLICHFCRFSILHETKAIIILLMQAKQKKNGLILSRGIFNRYQYYPTEIIVLIP